MTWTVQKQERSKGPYYSAVYAVPGATRKCLTLGYLAGTAATPELTARLRRFDPAGHWEKETLARVLSADSEEAAAHQAIFAPSSTMPPVSVGRFSPSLERAVLVGMAHDLVSGAGLFFPMGEQHKTTLTDLAEQIGKLEPATTVAEAPPVVPPPPRPVVVPRDPQGAMTLEDYFNRIWTPVRRQTASWERDKWWWEMRILPVLGEKRLCDIDEPDWTAFLAGLTVGGASKRLCQNAYRVGLRHAVDELKWLDHLHAFKRIPGSTKPSLAEPEPLEREEVSRLLKAAPSTMHRALFGTQFGQGLRPGEVITLQWEDINWRGRALSVAGTKNHLAAATVAMTPLTWDSLRPWWEERGCPVSGPLFFAFRGGGPLTAYPRGVLRRISQAAGLNNDRVRKVFPYLARHTFATQAADDGIHSAHTRRMMRHSSTSIVMEKAYEKASMRQVAKAFSAFGGTVAVDGERTGGGAGDSAQAEPGSGGDSGSGAAEDRSRTPSG